ncbi:hypothetical protein CGLO_07379 [Colletotrichum gloeosporioides Cg-14]|uniref:Uncharacterized protein n=1 Tax=Colletotrichum gloeosporioides (strain Cg-14) TaxID=1237896 RepID=T0LMP1_COLGC|nr:hypothetical protein CGLO_07379 [Colletotrichum gloeosporioides Cg-14]
MKLSVVFWALLHLAAEVCASTRASPWQMVMWYYTYRLHVAVVGLGVQAFAPCVSSSGTYCSFDEFAQYVQRTSKNYPITQWTIGTVDGRGLGDLPDPLKAVQAIQANLGEKVYSVQQAPTKLFPAKYTDPQANYRFDDMIKSLDANIVYLRQLILQHTSVDIDAWSGTSDMWKGFVTSVEGHKEMREADEWDKELSNVKNGFTQAGHTPFTKTVTSSVDGRTTWTELDPVQILPNSGMNGASYIHLVDTSKSAQSASHTSVIQQLDRLQSNSKTTLANYCPA